MLRGRALLTLLAVLAACDPRPQVPLPVPPQVEQKRAPAPLSKQQAEELAARCAKASREQFQRAMKDGIEATAEGPGKAEFRSHYNAALKTCFYLLTVTSSAVLKKMLFDVNGGELYGEYLGATAIESPIARPKSCRLESFYCASAGEWDVLLRPYMEAE